jgi:hypothetical protein
MWRREIVTRHIALALVLALVTSLDAEEPNSQPPRPANAKADAEKTNADAEKAKTDAEKAKAGLVKLIRKQRSLFMGNPDPDRLEKMPVKHADSDSPNTYYWSAFTIDVREQRYSAEIESDALKTAWFYSGKFRIDKAGQWIAEKPKVMEAFFDRGHGPDK